MCSKAYVNCVNMCTGGQMNGQDFILNRYLRYDVPDQKKKLKIAEDFCALIKEFESNGATIINKF